MDDNKPVQVTRNAILEANTIGQGSSPLLPVEVRLNNNLPFKT